MLLFFFLSRSKYFNYFFNSFTDHIRNPVEGDQIHHQIRKKKNAEFAKKVKNLLQLNAPDLGQETNDAHVPDLHTDPMTESKKIMINHLQVLIEKNQKRKNENSVHHQVAVVAAAVVQHPAQNQ